jgi:hypothetical protein
MAVQGMENHTGNKMLRSKAEFDAHEVVVCASKVDKSDQEED